MRATFDGFRKKLEILYARYDIYLLPALKFILDLSVYAGINVLLGYMEPLDNIFVVIVMALISAILPLNAVVVLAFLLCTAHCFGLGLEVGAFAAVIFLLMALLYFRFVPGDSLALVMTPAAAFLQIPCAVPLALGILRGPVSALSAIFGVAAWKFLDIVRTDVAPVYGQEGTSGLEVLGHMGNGLFRDGQTWILMLAAAVVVLLVTSIRKLGIAYAETISIAVGCCAYLAVTLGGSVFVGTSMAIPALIAGTLGAGAIVWLLAAFVYSPDYAGSTRLQFEDDEYYYYVKAVPKRGTAGGRTASGRKIPVPEGGMRSGGPMSSDFFMEGTEEQLGVDYEEELEKTLRDL